MSGARSKRRAEPRRGRENDATTRAKVGVIGLGIMGGAMAEELLRQGHPVTGYDPVPAARARLRRAKGRPCTNNAAVARAADVIIVSVASSDALADVAREVASVHSSRRAGGKRIVIEMSTLPIADKEAARKRLEKAGYAVLDCPVSGTAVRLRERTWTIFVSGAPAACRAVQPILKVLADKTPYIGPFGDGTKMKFAANHLVAIYNAAYGEVITLARKMGLDARRVLEILGGSDVLGTGVFRLRGAQMVKRVYTPPTMKIAVWQKDMQVIGDHAKAVGAPTPIFTAAAPLFTAAMAQGLALQDTAAVCEVLHRMAGIPEPRARRARRSAAR